MDYPVKLATLYLIVIFLVILLYPLEKEEPIPTINTVEETRPTPDIPATPPRELDGNKEISDYFVLRETEVVTKEEKEEIEEVINYTIYDMEVTAYDLSYASCGKYPSDKGYGVTASGKKIGKDIFEEEGIIASPKDFDFGTKMEVEGWGTGTVWDRGGAIKYDKKNNRYRLDIFINDHSKAMEWGRRIVKVKVYE